MATTEEMNRVLSDYDDYIRPWGYHESWDALHAIWIPLRHELIGDWIMACKPTVSQIEYSFATNQITEAHRLIYEAITWLNKNKGK